MKHPLKYMLFLMFTFVLQTSLFSETPKTDSALDPYQETGFFSYKEHCGVCHSIKPPAKEGPPLEKVLSIYLEKFPDSTKFVKRIFNWVKHPKPGASLMIVDVMKHKLMPKLPYDDATINRIAEWMWKAASCKEAPEDMQEPDLGSC